MTNHEKLQENYEDSLFALLMDEFARSEGERLIQENDRLKQDPAAAVPEEVERRCLRLIERETTKHRARKTTHGLLHILGRLVLAALIAVMLFGAAFALSPSFRAGTLNLLLQIDDKVASWQFTRESSAVGSADADSQLDVFVGWLPEGYERETLTYYNPQHMEVSCTNDDGELIKISIHPDSSSFYAIDIEDSYYSDLSIHGFPGLLIEKDDSTRIAWADSEKDLVIFVISSDVPSDTLLQVAESIEIAF